MRTVLTVAGFDPSSGAGITADLMTFAAHGLFGVSCITALTVQSTLGVSSVHPVSPQILSATLHSVFDDLRPAGIKIGMIGSIENVQAICEFLESFQPKVTGNPIVVLDPVLRSSSGSKLIDDPGATVVRDRLLSVVDWITPNTAELAWLTGLPVETRSQLQLASAQLQSSVAREPASVPLGIVATGGHLDPPDDLVLDPSGTSAWLAGHRVQTRSTHGTGCAFSSAFLSRLVLGDPPREAARRAKAFVAGALKAAPDIGHGNGPMDLLWPLRHIPGGAAEPEG